MSRSKAKPKPEARLTPIHWQFEAIGTLWNIEIFETLPATAAAESLAAVRARIAAFDKTYSRFRSDSWVMELAKKAGTYQLPADARLLFDLYSDLYGRTQGAMTPLIGSTMAEAGYDAQYSLQPKELHRPLAWSSVQYTFPLLTTPEPIQLDVGAAGKGYLVDIVSELLVARGVQAFCVDAGGDMRCRGTAPLDVGLEHPDRPGEIIGVAHLAGQSLCGSAGNRRAWGNFHHIIDAQALRSPRHIRAIWVVAPTALVADGLTTALYFAPAAALTEQYDFEYAIVHQDFSLEHSAHFPATFFTKQVKA